MRVYRSSRSFLGRATNVRAVDGVSFTVERGRTLGIVGESGCGKSTTGRLALGLEPPDGGRVIFDGAPLPMADTIDWRRKRARLQLIYQDPLGALDRRLPVGDQVREPLEIHDIDKPDERSRRVAELFDSVGLNAGHQKRYPHELSGGQRQRAVLARALATRPDLIVCDEPVSALDVSIQAQVVNLLIDLQRDLGMAMMFISHDLKVVRQISHRVAVMYLGRIIEEGEADTLFSDPRHPYTQALVSASPTPGVRGARRIVLAGEPPSPAARPSGCAFHPRCPAALPLCRREAPSLKPDASGRIVACHRANDGAALQ